MNTGCLLLLLYPSIADIRFKKFYVTPILVIAVLFAGVRLYQGKGTVIDILLGCLPGMMIWILCLLTKEAIGTGDAAVITGLGMIAGWKDAGIICFMGLMICGILGLVLIACGKADRKTELPFIPFLLIAFFVLWLYRRWN